MGLPINDSLQTRPRKRNSTGRTRNFLQRSNNYNSSNVYSLAFLCVCFLLAIMVPTTLAQVPCLSDHHCDTIYGVTGGKCVDLKCTNPFHSNGGCLASMLGGDKWKKNLRVCHSDDPPDAAETGACRNSPLQEYYTEVRVLALGWESVFFQAWIMQILLSEVLQIPVSVETGYAGQSTDFYGIDTPLAYGTYDANFKELQLSSEILDCRKQENDPQQPDDYVACAHVVPEVWESDTLIDSKAEGTGPFRELGMLAGQHWYIPRFTAEKDPSLTTVFGLAGQANRKKLASIFKRPTTWKEYCEEVSETNCATDDGIAARPPTADEESSMFQEGLYTGHFRATAANNCTGFPNEMTCTGHFADYPCTWNPISPQQIYHNEIALESNGGDASGGYTYSQLVGIWRAANATKSDVMMMWWTPEALFEEFFGSDAEFIPVILPAPTQECNNNRLPRGNLCDESFDITTTSPKGACDYSVQPIKRLIGDGLFEASFNPDIPEALHSPAYTTIENFRITSLQLSEIFTHMSEKNVDFNFDARFATCKWVAENIDDLLSFVPESHPRIIEDNSTNDSPLFVASLVIACLTMTVVLFAFCSVGMKRNTKVVFYAQVEFLILFLMGLFLLSVGAILLVAPHTNESCITIAWLINLGYALHLAPLTSKVFAINSLLSTNGKQMQRVRLSKGQLYRGVVALAWLVIAFMIVWTVRDPPEQVFDYKVTGKQTVNDETIIESSDYCGSESTIWRAVSLAWQGALLLPTAVVAFVACRVREDMNDTRTLSMVVYAHFLFLVFRVTVYLLDEGVESAELMAYRSLLISADVFVAVATYFFPLLFAREEMEEEILPDLFLNSTIMVADVMGFAAWSSAREPHQVFKLLETLYEIFDEIAEKHKVFKVETVRDCYVAATGIPDPQIKHAEIMAKFAIEVLKKMDHVSKKLELMFGPDTGDLTIRTGIHSGPVTGGFLKGKGARFQLFGDTMSTACLMQTTGMSNRIHLSQVTANLLIESGRRRWIHKREGKVKTEGKGELETYWLTRGVKDIGNFADELNATSSIGFSDFGSQAAGDDDFEDLLVDSEARWIEWNVDVLSSVLKKIVAQRATWSLMDESSRILDRSDRTSNASVYLPAQPLTMPLDEVAEIIELPEFDKKAFKRQRDNSLKKELDSVVVAQLKEYVTIVASMYKDNPFHNFAHASYVVMAVSKYMNRIAAASELDLCDDGYRQRSSAQRHEALHDHTYGITSDPLTHFACVFSALIHDIDHPGVPNPQFLQENERLARVYKKRSVAEQNSFDLAWDLLMDDTFAQLRNAICADASEFARFRQIVVNSVMATDLGDKELKELRNERWKIAFRGGDMPQEESLQNYKNRKATIVIEHLIQAADVAHTCQHWSLYRKWNERLFQECYKAYRDGRAEKNPADGWYEGEIGFYDFYIIPLAMKLRDCGVFGPTSDENLDYAQNNRAQWEKEGRSIVAAMLETAEKEYSMQNGNLSNDLSLDSEFMESMVDDERLVISDITDEEIMAKFNNFQKQNGDAPHHHVLSRDSQSTKETNSVFTDEHITVRFKDGNGNGHSHKNNSSSDDGNDDSDLADSQITVRFNNK